MSVLDDLRKQPKKFSCLNDNTNPNEDHANKMVHAVMIDFLESVLPVPSSFELPQDYRNKLAFLSFFHAFLTRYLKSCSLYFRFLHTHELWRWQLLRNVLTVITYVCVILLVVMVIAGYYRVDIDAKLAAFWNTSSSAVQIGLMRDTKDYNTV